jgi:hypothetical protein
VRAESFDALKAKLANELKVDGLNSTLHPQATAALKEITDATGPQTLQQIETMRRIARDAADTFDNPANARQANNIIDAIDEFVDNAADSDLVSGNAKDAAALKEARSLYTRKRKAEDIERMIEKAQLAATGFENGLRNQFRALANNDRKIRRFTKEEQAAIRRVAEGGGIENAARLLGKTAPTGIVSGGLSSGAGLVMGGPVGAVALPAIGWGARKAAESMTSRNARSAAELMRRGPVNADLLTKGSNGPLSAAPQVPRAASGIRSAAAVQADISRLAARVQVELASESAGSPKVREALSQLQALQRELEASRAGQ